MNTYFSRQEKILMTRIMVLSGLMMETIKEYEKGKPDKAFMRDLRTANTWMGKAMDRRFEFLEKDEYLNFIRHIDHMDILFVPNDKAKKERENLARIQDSVYISADDFEQLFSAILPYACGDCPRGEDFHKCKLRELFMKLGILPVDTEARDACQYDYLAAGIDLMEWAATNLRNGVELDDWAKQLAGKAKAAPGEPSRCGEQIT